MLTPFRVLYKIYVALWFVFFLILLFPIFYFLLAKESRFRLAFKLMRVNAKLILFVSGIWVKVEGKERLNNSEPVLMCANHSSFMDIPVIYSIYPSYFIFTGKKEIEKWPLFKIFYTSGMNILVDRHSEKGDIKAFRKMLSAVDQGDSLFIFPEGTITKEAPKMGEFKSGVVSIALKKQIPILPLTFMTNWKRIERKGFFKGKASPGVAHVIVHPKIDVEQLNKLGAEKATEYLKSIIEFPLLQKV